MRKRNIVVSHPKRKCYIYFSEEGDDVNKPLLLSMHPTFHTFLPNPGCKRFSAALSTVLDFSVQLGHGNPSELPDHGRDVGSTLSRSFV